MTTDDGDPDPTSAEVAGLDAVQLTAHFAAGELTSVEVVEQLVGRIEALDSGGNGLHSVLEVAPDALEVAAALDAERRAGRVR
ncbi:MAG TPA: hypothetical protein VKR78_01820, partial [Acidimicrobiales bacterium]|nr:hypothetical protein [Acidimicrobiales bacterium]